MKTTGGLYALVLLMLGLSASGCLFVLNIAKPDLEPIARDPTRVERGKYLVENVASCFTCHPRSSEIGPESRFWKETAGDVWAPNLTPDPETGLGNWTDGQILRAIREGVDVNHEALIPVMPYRSYAELSDEDAKSMVAYLRTLQPVSMQIPPKRLDFPFSLLVNLIPRPVKSPVPQVDSKDAVARGKYLVMTASCASCHTPHSQGGPDQEKTFAGGMVFSQVGTATAVTSPNITSDIETGIGGWTDDMLREAITRGVLPGGRKMIGPMPWMAYAGMTTDDILAVIAYVKTIPPIRALPRKAKP